MTQIRVYPTPAAVAQAAAARFVSACDRALVMRGRFVVCLSGGSTPRDLYRLLAEDEYTAQVDWLRTHVFWGDERCVPLDDVENNANMARKTLLDQVPIPMNHIHRVASDLPPEAAAQNYEDTLREFFGSRGMDRPRFDLLLLGIGSDAHTASLFPHSDALRETERWVVPTYVEKLDSWRVTLTPPALNAASRVIFLVTGEDKAPALARILNEPANPDEYPAQIIDPRQGQVIWVVDKAAASALDDG